MGKYSIKIISNSCGIKDHTLRIWEKRYGVFKPTRSESGRRLYSDDDLKKANLLAELIANGYSISSIADESIESLENKVKEIKELTGTKDQNFSQVDLKGLLTSLSEYKIDKVAEEIQHLRLSVGAKEFIFNIVLPTLREIGVLVAKGKYTVTQEHIISTIVRDQLSQIYLPNLGDLNKTIAFATPDGNLHELSIIIGDILARANRVPSRYLGAAHPAECLAEALNALKVPRVVLGVVSSDQWDYDKKIIPYLNKLDKLLNYAVEVWLGGAMPKDFPSYQNIKLVRVITTLEDFDKLLEA